MPLIKSASKKAVGKNIGELVSSAIAIALENQRKSKEKKRRGK